MGKADSLVYVECGLIMLVWIILPSIFALITASFENPNPRCYLNDLYIPALNTFIFSNATGIDNFIFFDLSLQNMMVYHNVHYHDINITISYGPKGQGNFPVANYTVPGFRQGKHATDHWRPLLNSLRGISWVVDALVSINNGSSTSTTAVFRVELATTMKKRIKSHKLILGADVEVNHSGELANDKAIRLLPSDHSAGSQVGDLIVICWAYVAFAVYLLTILSALLSVC